MGKKITRKQMKRNELVETMGRTMDYVSHHRRGVAEGIIGAVAAAALVAGFFLVRAYRENRAGKELSEALAALETPLAGQPAAASAPKTYPNAAERDRAAEAHLRLAAGIRGTGPGRAATVILAARASSPDAAATLERLARQGKAEVAASAELDAARLLAAQGKKTEAIERLKRAIESPASAAPKDALLFELAQIYEESGSSSDARATYQRLISDYPNSPYRSDARQKIPGS
jgi:tetratricopeptide (TPR) repeat protein